MKTEAMYELLNSIDCVTMIDKKIKYNKKSNKKKKFMNDLCRELIDFPSFITIVYIFLLHIHIHIQTHQLYCYAHIFVPLVFIYMLN